MAKRPAGEPASSPSRSSKQACLDLRQQHLLTETWNVNDPIHGMIRLPKLLKKFIDHRYFQRLRHIRQLSMCCYVYPGASHDRFFHSIGCAYLSLQLMKSVRERQPELEISDVDVMCVAIAGLLHDIGHPCFSHMFEHFVHRVGRSKPGLSEEQRRRYAAFEHEDASVALVRLLWADIRTELEAVGLSEQDLEFVVALISPPKKELAKSLEAGSLGEEWPRIMPCRPREKGWMFEIVSNWRSGLDTDRFDYFRRDALHLGIAKQFDHWRYMQTVRATRDKSCGAWTLSPPDKDKDFLREDMLELRRSLHRKAYQHKTTQKLEQHMIDVLELLEASGLTVTSADGRALAPSAAAVDFDASAYVQLTDSFVESRLFELQPPGSSFRGAYEEYERRIIKRHMFRLVADFDVPPDMDFQAYSTDEIIANTLQTYRRLHENREMRRLLGLKQGEQLAPPQDLQASSFRCSVAEFHQGMKRKDPLMRVLFYSSKDPSQSDFLKASEEVPPLTQKVFLFYDGGQHAHDSPLMRQLVESFLQWAVSAQAAATRRPSASLQLPESAAANEAPTSPRATGTDAGSGWSPQRKTVEPARLQNSPNKVKVRRTLSVRSSCPMDMDP
eukprot:TRINITY_DN90835_c0_g1_i1.p1 TRINITY_DN90835_c0_g1~~TRINITY_DN90835_c0_g1_i1.p1  ORF type:complete len:614 (+),score=99.01 TRINITY_DN90835_c0_g1_i1:28-1869(+)